MLSTGLSVHKAYRELLINFESITERIFRVRIRGKYRNISIINVHACTGDLEMEMKEEFYDKIE